MNEYAIVTKDGNLIFNEDETMVLIRDLTTDCLYYTPRDDAGRYLRAQRQGLIYVSQDLPDDSTLSNSEHHRARTSAQPLLDNSLPSTSTDNHTRAGTPMQNLLDNSLPSTDGHTRACTPMQNLLDNSLPTTDDHTRADTPTQNLSGITRSHWSRSQVLGLIETYKDNKHLFDNATVRNQTVWEKIANTLGNHSTNEVINKFKYLKTRYIKKKDNMSERATGSKKVHFEFFDEFDAIFGREPNITPVTTAASLRDENSQIDERRREDRAQDNSRVLSPGPLSRHNSTREIEQEQEDTPLRSTDLPRKKKKLVDHLQSLQVEIKRREESRERRHKESMEAITRVTSILERFLEK